MRNMISTALLLATTLTLAACDDDDIKVVKPDAPILVSSSPTEGGHVGVGEVDVTLKFDKRIFFYCGDADKITITSGSIESAEVYASSDSTLSIVALCPNDETNYTITVPAGLITASNNVAGPQITLNFSTGTSNISNQNATAKTVALYDYLTAVRGTSTLSAMMANVNWNNDCSKQVADWTGRYPAINCYDYIHMEASYENQNWIDYSDLTPVTEWYNAGGIVAAGWHWIVPPTNPYSSTKSLRLKATTGTVLWEDTPVVVGSWSGWVQIEASAFAEAQIGQYIRVGTTDLLSGALGAFKSPADWDYISGKDNDYFDITGDYTLEITSDILTKLQTSGLIVQGCNYTITGVYLEDSDTTGSSVSGELWSGSLDLGTGTWSWDTEWLHLTESADLAVLANLEVGMYVNVTITNIGSDAQIKFADGNVGNIYDDEGNDVRTVTGNYALEVTVDNIDAIKTGLHIGGQNCTITSVYISNSPVSADDSSSSSSSVRTVSTNDYTYEINKGFTATNALTDGTWENQVINEDLERIATYLKLLADKDIPVLWRPLHEASGQWFWWGESAESHKELWIKMYNYFKNEGINNLIWVWTSEGNDTDWYPGDEYVDIVGFDLYGDNATSCLEKYNTGMKEHGGKMITLSECGYTEYEPAGRVAKISEQWEAGAKWLWFMPWYDNDGATTTHADADWWNDAMSQDYVLDRDAVKGKY